MKQKGVLLRGLLFLALLCLSRQPLGAYEPSMLNLKVPSGLEPYQLELLILHRFYGSVTASPLKNALGTALGANAGLGLRFKALPWLEFNTSYASGWKEFTIGTSADYDLSRLLMHAQLDLQYFNYGKTDARAGSFYTALSLQSAELLERLRGSLVVAYDGYFRHLGLGGGLILKILDNLELVGEFYPLLKGKDPDAELGDRSVYAGGLIFKTWGHQFSLLVGNSYEIGQRRLMAGTDVQGLYLGFNIQRLFSF